MYQPGQIIKGQVIDTKPYGAFLKFEDGSQGLLHISEISDKYIRDIELFVSVEDIVNVLVMSIDDKDGFMRVSYKKVPPEKRFSTHTNKRKPPVCHEEDFESLKRMLPKWIEDTLKEKEEKKNGN